MYAINPDGTERWRLHTGGVRPSSPVIDPAGTIYLGVNDSMRSVTPDGKLRNWGLTQTEPDQAIHMDGAPALTANGWVLFSSSYGTLFAWPTNTAEPAWSARVGGGATAAVAVGPDGTVYLGHDGNHFNAYRGASPPANSPWPLFRGNPRQNGRWEAPGK